MNKEGYEVKIRVYKKYVDIQSDWKRHISVGSTSLHLERGEKIVHYEFDSSTGELYILTQSSPRIKDLEYM